MTIRIDLSDLLRGIPIEANNIDKLVDQVASKIALDLHGELVMTTPVDTGRARAAWTVDTAGPEKVVENNVEYIGALNAGHSKQAPASFVENAIDKVTKL